MHGHSNINDVTSWFVAEAKLHYVDGDKVVEASLHQNVLHDPGSAIIAVFNTKTSTARATRRPRSNGTAPSKQRERSEPSGDGLTRLCNRQSSGDGLTTTGRHVLVAVNCYVAMFVSFFFLL